MNGDGRTAVAVMEPDQEEQLRSEITPVVQQANAIVVGNAEQFQGAALFLKGMKASQKKVAEFFAPMKTAAMQAHRRICEAERTFLEPLQSAERAVKVKMSAWQAEEDRKAEKERLRLQAEAEEKARHEREKLERRAEAAAEKGKEEKAGALREQAEGTAAPLIDVRSRAPKVSGINTRKVWKAEVKDLPAFLEFAAKDATGVFRSVITVNESALGRIVKGDKAPTIPGVVFRQETIIASGSR